MADVCFVLAPGQNQFFFELADVLRHELEAIGVPTSLSTEGFPDVADDRVYALLPPHEYFALEGAAHPPPPGAMRRTILICAEQPETIHFRQNLALAASGGALFVINARAVRAYRRRGVRAEHLRLGYTSLWDRFHTAESHRDVLFLGAYTRRRGEILAGMAEDLASVDARIVLSDNSRPNPGGSATYLAGAEKWDALSASRILLNIHQGGEPYFEWHRVLQAIHCGAAVLTEDSSDFEPLEPGADFDMAPGADLAESLRRLAGDEERRRSMAKHAYHRIRNELPMRETAERLAAAAGELSSGGRSGATPLGRFSSRAAGARLRAAERFRRHRPRPPEPGVAPSVGTALRLEPVEGRDDLVLITSNSLTMLRAAVPRLRAALDESDAHFAFGLVAAPQEGPPLGNAAAPDESHPPVPPVLLRRAALGSERASRDPAAALSALSAMDAVGVQQFVARAGARAGGSAGSHA